MGEIVQGYFRIEHGGKLTQIIWLQEETAKTKKLGTEGGKSKS